MLCRIIHLTVKLLFLDDVKVVFSEYDEAGNLRWQDYGDFGPNDVHKQVTSTFIVASVSFSNQSPISM